MKEIICILCPNGCHIEVSNNGTIKGNLCKKGIKYAFDEINNPKRVICSTVKTTSKLMPRLPVKTDNGIPKELINDLMKELKKVVINNPVHINEVIIKNVLDTDINIISTADMFYVKGENSE